MKKYVHIIAAFWLILILIPVARNEFTLNTGHEILLETVPVDPRDILRGDYVILNYKIAQLPKTQKFNYNENVYVILNTDKENIGHFEGVSRTKPKGLFLKGKVSQCQTTIPFYRSGSCISFGIESYFVKEKTGLELENHLRDGALVKVAIDRYGNAKVKGFAE